MTSAQIIAGSKTVTRRLGWRFLQPGQLVRPVRQVRGLKRGEKLQALRGPLQIVDVRQEPLRRLLEDPEYGRRECRLEGFGDHPDYQQPELFVQFFCATHRGCTPDSAITRIEFFFTD